MPEDRQFVGFDAYKKAMDCLKPGDMAIFATPLAFRWVHFAYAIEKGLNVFMEKPRDGRRPDVPPDAQAGRRGGGEEPQGGRGLDVASQPARCSNCISASRTAKSATSSDARLPDARPDRVGVLAKDGRAAERIAVADSTVPQLPLGQRRLLQRLLHPHHRPLLLDEERLAGQGPGAGRPPLSPEPDGNCVDQNFDTYSVEYTFADGAKFIHGRPLHGGLPATSTPATRTAPRARRSSPRPATAGRLPAPTKARTPNRANMIWESKSRAGRGQSLPERMERPGRRHPQRQALQRGEARRRGQPGDFDGPHGRPHRPGNHLRGDAQLRPRIRAGRGQVHDGFARRRCKADANGKYPIPQPGIIVTREF